MIEGADSLEFRGWVEQRLKDISDADSEILTNYVMALLQHDLPIGELKILCVEQLEDFLQDNTKAFVDDMLLALESKSYLGSRDIIMSAESELPAESASVPAYDPNAPEFVRSGNDFRFATGNITSQIQHQQGGYQNWQQQSNTATRSNDSTRQSGNPYFRKRGKCRSYEQKGYCLKGDLCPYEHGTERIMLDKPIPLAGSGNDWNNRNGSRRQAGGGQGNSRFPSDNMRYITKSTVDKSNTSVVVDKIPDENFDIDSIRTAFEPFGTIASIELNDDGRQRHNTALVIFENHESARKAWSSAVPFFQNRFVKVYWKQTDADLQAMNGGSSRGNMSGRDGRREAGWKARQQRDRSASPSRMSTQPETYIEEIRQRQAEKQREYEERMTRKREHEARLEEMNRAQADLLRRQNEERAALLEKIKAKEASSSESASNSLDINPQAPVSSTTNSTTDELKKKLDELKKEAERLGISVAGKDSTNPYSFRGGLRGRGRGRAVRGAFRGSRGGFATGFARSNLDLRTKKIAVTGIDNDQAAEAFATHLITELGANDLYSGMENHPTDPKVRIISFKDRPAAERFLYSGSLANEVPGIGKVSGVWYNPPHTTTTETNKSTTTPGGVDYDMADDLGGYLEQSGTAEDQWRQGIGKEENGNGMAMHEDEDADVY
ncbi:uncharacterized protein V1516DRAFT_425990 [Lipomyces oligophaga]|uniref:uncharacterized protein n=1 Tax=Lipomyces oligophaga TaxID=45792 RepID=UPI0034CD78AB